MHERWMTKLVKSFDEGLIPNFAETWGTKNIFNPIFKASVLQTSPNIITIFIFLSKCHQINGFSKLNH